MSSNDEVLRRVSQGRKLLAQVKSRKLKCNEDNSLEKDIFAWHNARKKETRRTKEAMD